MGVSNIKIQGTGRFTDSTKNFGEVDQGEFIGSSSNRGVILSSATFAASSTNIGSISGTASFSGSAINTGAILGSAVFIDFTANTGSVSSVTFAGNAVNTGIVLGNATFTDNTVNTGTVSGSVIFYGDSINIGGKLNESASVYVDQPDPLFNNTCLLLNGNSAASANNIFIDSSTNNVTLSISGTNIGQSTFSPFSTNDWSTRFNGSTTYITLNDSFISATALSGIGTGKTTFEMWIYPLSFSTSGANGTTLMGAYWTDAVANRWYLALTPNANLTSANVKFTYLLTTSVESSAITTSLGVKTSQWNHVAVTIDATTPSASIIEIFINGVKSASRNNNNLTTHASSQVNVRLGGNLYAQNYFHGYMSNVRVTKNQILYTTNFTPSVYAPLTTTSQGASGSNVILLTCKNKTRLRNEGSVYIPFTTTGSPSTEPFNYLSTNFSYNRLLAGGSCYFNNSNLSFNSDSRFALGTSNFTIDMWVYPTVGAGVIFKMGGGITVYDVAISLNASLAITVNFWPTGLGLPALRLVSTAAATPLSSWSHIAVVRSGTGANQTKLYINGVENGATTQGTAGTLNYNLTATGIGYVGKYNTDSYTGYVSNLRVVKGTAVYNGNFNPPSTSTRAISGTILMLDFTNGGIIDKSSDGAPIIPVEDTKSISTETKYNNRSIYFDGTGDYLTTSNTNFNFGTGNFTIEFWIYPLAYGSSLVGAQIFGTKPPTSSLTGYGVNLGFNASTFKLISNATGTYADNLTVTTNNGPALSAWSHMAVVRNGVNLSVYKNGVSVGTSTIAAGSSFAGTEATIGKYYDGGNMRDFRGYLSDLRVTKGVARYTTTFTPPSASLPTHG